jgi:hypothetical protein
MSLVFKSARGFDGVTPWEDMVKYLSTKLFGLGDFTKGLVDMYCKQVRSETKNRPPKSSSMTPGAESSGPKRGRRPDSLGASAVGNGENIFTEDHSQRTANIQLFRKNMLGMQSSHCIPETPVQECVAATTETRSVSDAGPSTCSHSRHTSVTEGSHLIADAPIITNRDKNRK